MMNSRTMLKLGVSALILGGVTVTGVATQGLSLSAFAASGANAKKAASEARQAQKAIAQRKGHNAVEHAELAVANDPNNAEYRALLGQAYLLAGRFASAGQALTDALTLDPKNGAVALNLALAKIGQGDWAGARTLLQAHAETIPVSDRGLALALAGDPVTAVEILTPAVRDASATAKTRQNLALSLALAGRWREATQMAAMDVPPDQLGARIMEWTNFARPTNAYDQVAALLGVRPIEDAGQPVALALSQQPNVAVAAAATAPAADPVDAYMPGATPAPVEQAAVEAPSEPQAEPQQVAGTGPQVVFGARDEIVQAVPAARVPAAVPVRVASATQPARTATAPRRASGNHYVQLGAYVNAAVARDAWARYTRRVSALNGTTPQGAQVSTRAGNFYRLSVGGFARTDADALCRQVKASGGNCFVRVAAGDTVASWVKPGSLQVASR
ncbi:MAG: SPOR domain-containing protein [Sphingomonas sp.]|uniref:SPOR domain-containing protein n=1 Tax=Sphingomonas sp. TaxID=28214 RepID=UPI001B03F620|nr:SPOR domain-containing protein [Sphingomonas sp.]MBO9624658.1 SPOR domain-containing protein [Sphingomonas sp.]